MITNTQTLVMPTILASFAAATRVSGGGVVQSSRWKRQETSWPARTGSPGFFVQLVPGLPFSSRLGPLVASRARGRVGWGKKPAT